MAPKKIGDWTATSALSLHLRKGGMSLHVGITAAGERDQWNVLAISAPAKAGAQAVLDSHAHKLIGMFDLGTAIKEAEKYARAWRPSKERCDCGDIHEAGTGAVPPTEVGSGNDEGNRRTKRDGDASRRHR